MRNATPSRLHVSVPLSALALLALPLLACSQSTSVTCSTGLVCPASMACSMDGTSCIGINTQCGDGARQDGEACDDGNTSDNDGCNATCSSSERCGNLYTDTVQGEVCDDGNTTSGDGCSADCRSRELCGNSITDKAISQACDDGNTTSGDGCSADCRSIEVCGNGVTDFAKGERCDDGNTVSGDGCSSDCKSDESCGNRVVDLARDEVCDDGNHENGDKCSANCLSAETCGNGTKDVGEACDDGNTTNGDGCSADCSSGEKCGNGIRDGAEECDDGNSINTDDCIECKLARCGDKFKDSQAPLVEQCDPALDPDTCNPDCTISACGDGIVNARANEQCDNVNAVNGTTCDQDCTAAYCGDGFTNPVRGEECDGESNCLSNCKLNRCGNGIVDPGEACDDGNTDACGRCDATCSTYRFTEATGHIVVAPGDYIKDGETFSLSDGNSRHLPIIFEFDRNGDGVDKGHVHVDIPGKGLSAATVAAKIADAINLAPFSLNVTAQEIGSRVDLLHDHRGGYGNQRIAWTVGNSTFKAVGLKGGFGRDCTEGMGCMHDDDCSPRLHCSNNKICE